MEAKFKEAIEKQKNALRGLTPGHKLYLLKPAEDIKPRVYYPHELLEKFIEYEEWNNNNPLEEFVLHQKTGELISVPKVRAMSTKGFCLFAGMALSTYYSYKKDSDYEPIVSAIEDAIYTQKFENAAAGLLHAGIIVRDLGLTEVVKHTVNDERKTLDQLFPSIEDIEAIEIEETSDREIKKLNARGKED